MLSSLKGNKYLYLRLARICGTVLDRDKTKKIVTLLTTSGVVTVRFFGDIYLHYDRQISEKGPDGKKTRSREEYFLVAAIKLLLAELEEKILLPQRKYSRTPWHMVELIESVNEDGTIITRERVGVE